jgi:hypothetical protein
MELSFATSALSRGLSLRRVAGQVLGQSSLCIEAGIVIDL